MGDEWCPVCVRERCVQVPCEWHSPIRFRITNTSPIPTIIRVTVPGSGVETVGLLKTTAPHVIDDRISRPTGLVHCIASGAKESLARLDSIDQTCEGLLNVPLSRIRIDVERALSKAKEFFIHAKPSPTLSAPRILVRAFCFRAHQPPGILLSWNAQGMPFQRDIANIQRSSQPTVRHDTDPCVRLL